MGSLNRDLQDSFKPPGFAHQLNDLCTGAPQGKQL